MAARGRSSGALLEAARAAALITTDRAVHEARRRIEAGLKRPELLAIINALTLAIINALTEEMTVVPVAALAPVLRQPAKQGQAHARLWLTHSGSVRQFSAIRSRFRGDLPRRGLWGVLRAGHADYVINEEAIAYMRERALAGHVIERLLAHPERRRPSPRTSKSSALRSLDGGFPSSLEEPPLWSVSTGR